MAIGRNQVYNERSRQDAKKGEKEQKGRGLAGLQTLEKPL